MSEQNNAGNIYEADRCVQVDARLHVDVLIKHIDFQRTVETEKQLNSTSNLLHILLPTHDERIKLVLF